MKIISGGLGSNTRIFLANGIELKGIQKVSFEVEAGGRATATITLVGEIEADLDAYIVRVQEINEQRRREEGDGTTRPEARKGNDDL